MGQNGNAFECRMCGQCCQGEGGIILGSLDIQRLCKGLGLSREDFLAKYTLRQNHKTQLLSQNGNCIFFSRDQGCLVHTHKPDICRAWPFFQGNLRDEQSWLLAQDYCPGINQDVEHQEFVHQGLEYLQQNKLIYSSQDPEAPAALLKDDQGLECK
ncbi:MAG: YkgJ family cysteine cluster protein [Desulfohalobiaceae bacterium]